MIYGKGNTILKQSTLINHGTDESLQGFVSPKGYVMGNRGFMSTYISRDCADPEPHGSSQKGRRVMMAGKCVIGKKK